MVFVQCEKRHIIKTSHLCHIEPTKFVERPEQKCSNETNSDPNKPNGKK